MFNVIVKIVGAGKLQITNRGLSLKEYKVIGDGETTVTVTIFENLCNSVDINKAYKLTNLQIVTYKNERKLRSTSLTSVIECNLDIPGVEESTIAEENETLTKEEEDIVAFDNVSDHSLLPQRSCIKCSAFLVETNERLVKCSSCHSIHLASIWC